MMKWFRRLRGALGMGVTWALGWGIIGGALMEGIFDRGGQIVDMWPQTLAIPGFLLGIVFSVILWAAEGRRRFDEMSYKRFAALGAIAGGALGLIALAAGIFPAVPFLLRAAMVMAPLTALSAASASGTLALARKAEERGLISAGVEDELLEPTPPRDRLPRGG